MELKDLASLRSDMAKCFRCSLCKMLPLPVVRDPAFTDACPASRLYHFHGYSGSGKQIMALSLIDGRIEADGALAKVAFACTACGYCDVACKFIMDAERHKVNMTLRAYLVDRGLSPPAHVAIMDNLRNPEGRPLWGEGLNLKRLPGQKSEILIFAGCAQKKNSPSNEAARKLAKILIHCGIDVGMLSEGDPCCGLPAYWLGYHGEFSAIAAKNSSLLDACGAGAVVVVSGSCLGAFRSKYPEFAVAPKVKILHFTEYLEKLIEDERLKLTKPIVKKVTYHDPCYLGRQSEPFVKWDAEERIALGCMTYTDPPRPVNRGVNGVYDAPREILEAVPGLDFREMHRIREYSFCCGAGGGVPLAYPELAREAALHRIAEAVDVGAECLVTACAHCENHLSASQDKMPILDIIDLVYEAAGIGQ